MSLLTNATTMHEMGANVLPIRNGKKPALEWDRLQTERQSVEELKSYDWEHYTGLGIVCGINGFVCIDIDKMKSADIVSKILHELNLNDTYQWQVRSGSGTGYHIWVRVQQPLPFPKGVVFGDSQDGSFDHIEIRWKDCQTVMPPSVHESGNRYEWVNGEPTSEPSEVDVESIISMFEAVAFMHVEDPNKEKPKYRKTDYTEVLQNGVPEGKRNDTLASLSGHYRCMGMEYGEAIETLKIWNSRLSLPLPVDEVETTVSSIYSMPSSDMILRDGIEMSSMNTPEMKDIVEGIIGERSFNFIAGEEGAGKSLLAMNLSLSIATGLPKFLGYNIKKHGRVLYLNNELPFSVHVGRFKRMRRRFYRVNSQYLNRFVTPEFLKPLDESWEDIVKHIKGGEYILVVLDCLYWAHDKKENDSSDMKDIMRKLISLRDQYGVAVLVVHHTKKGTRYETMHNDNMRGSMVFGASSDTVMMLRRSATDESKRLLKPTKLRNGDDNLRKAHLLELGQTDLWFSDLGEVNEEDHIAIQGGTGRKSAEDKINFNEIFGADKELPRKDIVERCKKLGFEDRTIDRCLESASASDGALIKPKYGWYSLKPTVDPATPAVPAV